jgi:hypothetical protein
MFNMHVLINQMDYLLPSTSISMERKMDIAGIGYPRYLRQNYYSKLILVVR